MPFDHKEYYKNNKDRINANKRKWRSKPENKVKDKLYKENNKDRANELQKIWRDKNREHYNNQNRIAKSKPHSQFVDKIGSWKRQGIIDSDYKLLYDCYKSQTHCWICLKEYKSSYDKCIDHDHETGETRYICCRSCNISIVR